jgi:hypothetical protein
MKPTCSCALIITHGEPELRIYQNQLGSILFNTSEYLIYDNYVIFEFKIVTIHARVDAHS